MKKGRTGNLFIYFYLQIRTLCSRVEHNMHNSTSTPLFDPKNFLKKKKKKKKSNEAKDAYIKSISNYDTEIPFMSKLSSHKIRYLLQEAVALRSS